MPELTECQEDSPAGTMGRAEVKEGVAQAPSAICKEPREGTLPGEGAYLPGFSACHLPPLPQASLCSPSPSTRRSSVYVQGARLSPGFQSTSAVSW